METIYQKHMIRSSSLSHRFWSVVMVAMLLTASFTYLYGIRGNLPYHLDPDEPVLYIAALEIRASGFPQIKPTYPPLRFYELALEQILADVAAGGEANHSIYFIYGRSVSAFTALLLLAVIYKIGCNLHSRFAGVIGVILLAFDIQMVEFSHLARGDTFAWLFGACVVLGTLRLLQQQTRRLWVPVMIFSMCAFLAKYSIAPVLILPIPLLVGEAIRRPFLKWVFIILAVIVFVGGVSVIFYLRANAEAWYFRLTDINMEFLVSDQITFFQNFLSSYTTIRLKAGDYWLLTNFSALPLALPWQRRRLSKEKLWLLMLMVAVISLTAFVSAIRDMRYWDGYQVIIFGAIFGGVGFAMLCESFSTAWLIATFAIVSALVIPKFMQGIAFDERYVRPNTFAILGNWFISNVPQGARVVVENATPFNSYVGFPGRTILHQFSTESLDKESSENYRERGYEYLIWSSGGRHTDEFGNYDTVINHPYFKNAQVVLRLKSDGINTNGHNLIVFQLPALPQHPLYLWFTPSISFRGYDLNKESFKPGDDLELMFYWMSAERVKANYIVTKNHSSPAMIWS
ncbi:MAG: glycosyltransferase family 39 protein [Chloroflexi bacterium]|nr:glycosyltransferase family 39 protein [Chloroflexota bacterium]